MRQAISLARTDRHAFKTVSCINPQRAFRFRETPKPTKIGLKPGRNQRLKAIIQPIEQAIQAVLGRLEPTKLTQFLQSLFI